MSEQNKALVRRYLEEAMNHKDLAALDQICAPGYVAYSPGYPYQRMTLAETKHLLGLYFQAFPDLHVTIETLVAEGDKVVHQSTFRGTQRGEFQGIPPTNKVVAISGFNLARIAGGRIVEDRGIIDSLGMLQQLGVIPAPTAAPAR